MTEIGTNHPQREDDVQDKLLPRLEHLSYTYGRHGVQDSQLSADCLDPVNSEDTH